MTALLDGTQRRASQQRPALLRLVRMPAAEFAATYWDRAPLLSRPAADHPAAADFTDLLSLAAVDELLAVRGLRTPFLRLARDGAVVPASRFTSGSGVGATVGDQVDAAAVAQVYASGATVVLQALHRTWPALREFTDQLVADLGHPVQVNAYLTPPSAQGFAAHYDTHDVLVVQVAGRKHWTVHEPVLERPAPDEPGDSRREEVAARAAGPATLEAELAPGDVLYLPRGWLHAARSGSEPTLHLTFGIHPLTGRDLLEAIASRARHDDRLRASLPLGVDLDEDPALEVLGEVLAEAVRDGGPDVAAALRGRLARDTRPEAVRPVVQEQLARTLTATTGVRLRRHLRARLEPPAEPGAPWRLRLPTGALEVAPTERSAVLRLLEGTPVTAAELPAVAGGHGGDARLDLVLRLVREAVLVPAD